MQPLDPKALLGRKGPILIIDDETDIRESLQEVLEMHGYQVLTASNGRDGLTVIMGASRPSLIFLDLMMPVMNGWEFIKHKNAAEDLQDISVVVISADSSAESKARALEVEDYLRKPIALERLLETVRKHCDLAS